MSGKSRGKTAAVQAGGGFDMGDFSADVEERPPLEASFTYFGESIRVNPDLTEVDMIDFLDEADRIASDDPRSMLMIKEAARTHVHPDDFERFWKTRKDHRQGTTELMATIWQIVGGVTGKAVGQLSDSSDGRPVINQNLPDDSSTPDVDQSLRGKYIKQIERLEAMGPNGVAMAAQVAQAAEARGVNVSRVDQSLAPTA